MKSPIKKTSSPGLKLHPATESDIPVIHDFITKLAEYEKLSHEMIATKAQLKKHLFGPKPVAEAIIARLAEKPVGFALFFTTFSTFSGLPGIWLEDLFVLKENRGVGIGKALLRAVAAIALKRKYGQLEWTVLDWNTPAVNLYRKLGAKPMSDWTTQRVTGKALVKLADK
jgi:GNAT superfamily N-acetyltransferase